MKKQSAICDSSRYLSSLPSQTRSRPSKVRPEIDQLYSRIVGEYRRKNQDKYHHINFHTVAHCLKNSPSNSLLYSVSNQDKSQFSRNYSTYYPEINTPKRLTPVSKQSIEYHHEMMNKQQGNFLKQAMPNNGLQMKKVDSQSTLTELQSRIKRNRSLQNLQKCSSFSLMVPNTSFHQNHTQSVMNQSQMSIEQLYEERYNKQLSKLRFEQRDYLIEEFSKRMDGNPESNRANFKKK